MRLAPLLFLCIFLIVATAATAQENSDSTKPKWVLSSYFESFIAFKGNEPKRAKISDFLYNHNRYNIPKVNHGLIGLEHQGESFRMNVGAHLGTYVEDNYKNEPGFLRNIYTANIGLRINKKKNRWIEAGIFPSYKGFESVNSFENLFLFNHKTIFEILKSSIGVGDFTVSYFILFFNIDRAIAFANNGGTALPI